MKNSFKLILPLISFPFIFIFFLNLYQNSINRDTLTEGIIGQPRHLLPLQVGTNPVDRDIVSLLYLPLFRFGEAGDIIPELADKYEFLDENKTIRIVLKESYWSDGKVFSSSDVLYTATKLPEFRDVVIEKVDDKTIDFKVKQPYAGFIDLLTFPVAAEHVGTEEKPLQKIISTGKFQISNINPAPNFIESITLTRKQHEEGKINTIIFKFFNDYDELKTAIELGDIDLFISEKRAWPGFNEYASPIRSIEYSLYFNLSNPILMDIDNRKLISKNIPQDYIATDVLNGKVGAIYYPLNIKSFNNSNLPRIEYNPSTESTLSGELLLSVPRSEDNIAVARIIRESLSRLGLTVDINVVDLDDFSEKVLEKRNYDILLLGREVSRDPDRYDFWHSSQTEFPGGNLSLYKQLNIDKNLEKGRQEFDTNARKLYYDQFQEELITDVPFMPLYQPKLFLYARSNIQGVDIGYIYQPEDRYNSIDNWQKD